MTGPAQSCTLLSFSPYFLFHLKGLENTYKVKYFYTQLKIIKQKSVLRPIVFKT